MNKNFLKFSAFTLAEVLITLGIIGVVAAVTMPTLIKNHKITQLENQFKVAYSTLSQGFKLIHASYGGDADLSQILIDNGITDDDRTSNVSNFLKKYFKITDVVSRTGSNYWPAVAQVDINSADCKNWIGKGAIWATKGGKTCFGGFGTHVIKLANGSWFIIELNPWAATYTQNPGKMKGRVGWLYVDVNGDKKPNTWGEDVFTFVIGIDGFLYPSFGRDDAYYLQCQNKTAEECGDDFYEAYWRAADGTDKRCNVENEGTGCGAKYIENAFQFDRADFK